MNARLTLALATALFALPSCEREQVSLVDLESQVAASAAATSRLRKDLLALRSELNRQQHQRDTVFAAIDGVRAEAAGAERSAQVLEREFDLYKLAYRDSILRRAPGMELGDLLVGGKPYHAVKVKSVDQWELSFSHASGTAKFPLRDLPDGLKNLFAFSPDSEAKPDLEVADSIPSYDTVKRVKPVAQESKPENSRQAPVASPPPVGTESSKGGNISVSGRTIGEGFRDRSGNSIEIIGRFGTSSIGGGGGSGKSVKGAKATVPQGYRPIGSTYEGTAMDKAKK